MPRILKGGSVFVDLENRVNIDVVQVRNNSVEEVKSYEELSDDEIVDEQIDLVALARQEAATIVEKAKKEAKRIIDEAINDGEGLRIVAENRGKEEGYAAGYQLGTENSDILVREANEMRAEYEANWVAIKQNAEPQMAGIIVNIFDKLFGDCVKLNPQIIINLIKQGFAESTITGSIKIKMSEEDYEYANQHKDEIDSLATSSVQIELSKEPSYNKGDCIIETSFGNIDCSLGHQYETIRNNLCYIFDNRNE